MSEPSDPFPCNLIFDKSEGRYMFTGWASPRLFYIDWGSHRVRYFDTPQQALEYAAAVGQKVANASDFVEHVG